MYHPCDEMILERDIRTKRIFLLEIAVILDQQIRNKQLDVQNYNRRAIKLFKIIPHEVIITVTQTTS